MASDSKIVILFATSMLELDVNNAAQNRGRERFHKTDAL